HPLGAFGPELARSVGCGYHTRPSTRGHAMANYSTNEFKAGLKILIDGDPYAIVENEMVKPGKGQAFNRVRVRNLKTGRTIERTWKSGDTVEADAARAYGTQGDRDRSGCSGRYRYRRLQTRQTGNGRHGAGAALHQRGRDFAHRYPHRRISVSRQELIQALRAEFNGVDATPSEG